MLGARIAGLMALVGAAMGQAIPSRYGPPTLRDVPDPLPWRWKSGTGRAYKPNGERECERRRRQIASGRLTKSNGLVYS